MYKISSCTHPCRPGHATLSAPVLLFQNVPEEQSQQPPLTETSSKVVRRNAVCSTSHNGHNMQHTYQATPEISQFLQTAVHRLFLQPATNTTKRVSTDAEGVTKIIFKCSAHSLNKVFNWEVLFFRPKLLNGFRLNLVFVIGKI
jgi:hypothetical protein